MNLKELNCGVCTTAEHLDSCNGSFRKIGLSKLHWECWADCNLHCNFCYRSVDAPLNTKDAIRLISICKAAGIERFVFAGGDPSLRKDLPSLIEHAYSIGLSVELQSNFQKFDAAIKNKISSGKVSLTGISLDGSTAVEHDKFRSTRGNFTAVMHALSFHEEKNRPVILRTVASKKNLEKVGDIARLISSYKSIRRWSILEFTPMGEGFKNKAEHSLTPSQFDQFADDATLSYSGHAEIDIYRASAKEGTYGLVTPSGHLYGVGAPTNNGNYPRVGSMLTTHLADLARMLPFTAENHLERYGSSNN